MLFMPGPLCAPPPCDAVEADRPLDDVPLETITASPAASVPRSGVTAACVPLIKSMCTGTGPAFPFCSTKTMPFPPAATLVPPAADVCPHGAAAEAEDVAEAEIVPEPDAVLCVRCLPLNAPLGRKLSACTGTTSALCAVCTPIEAFAVIPGSNV